MIAEPTHPSIRATWLSNWIVILLLGSILTTQVLILLRIPRSPPTVGAVRAAKGREALSALLLATPIVRVEGGVIEARVTGSVEVENTPLEVSLNR